MKCLEVKCKIQILYVGYTVPWNACTFYIVIRMYSMCTNVKTGAVIWFQFFIFMSKIVFTVIFVLIIMRVVILLTFSV